jgi:hypothetical protein
MKNMAPNCFDDPEDQEGLLVLLGCDLTGFTADSLVKCMIESKRMLWDLMYEVVDDDLNVVCCRDHKREAGRT